MDMAVRQVPEPRAVFLGGFALEGDTDPWGRRLTGVPPDCHPALFLGRSAG